MIRDSKAILPHHRLPKRFKKYQRKIPVGLIGAGSMGKGLFRQLSFNPGLHCAALVDIQIERAIACAQELGREYRCVDSIKSMRNAIQSGILAICEDGALVAECEGIEVLLEASNSIAFAGKICETALHRNKHVVMMNSEADLTFGPYLMELSRANGVIYTSCDGDQHGVLARLIDDSALWGFDLVLAGNIKGFLDRYSDPTAIIPEANKRNLDYKMATAYTDGTKLSIEMSLLANAYNLRANVPGMKGPLAVNVQESLHLFDLEQIWKSGQPVIDYLLGAQPGGGVFVIGRAEDPYTQGMMSYYKMGNGPFYLFYRPYHLCHIESMACILEAVHEGCSLLEPTYGFQTNVYAYAKRDLKEGEILDGLGGYMSYGLVENEPDNRDRPVPDHENLCDLDGVKASRIDDRKSTRIDLIRDDLRLIDSRELSRRPNRKDFRGQAPGLPICLSHGLQLQCDVHRDEKIFLEDVLINPERDDFRLFSKALHSARKLIN